MSRGASCSSDVFIGESVHGYRESFSILAVGFDLETDRQTPAAKTRSGRLSRVCLSVEEELGRAHQSMFRRKKPLINEPYALALGTFGHILVTAATLR